MRSPAEPAVGHTYTGGKFYTVAGLMVAGWILGHFGWLTGHVLGATRFILGDQGSFLYAVGRWQDGEALYQDFAWQYGPLALGWYRAFAAIGGNTPLMLVVASSAAFAVAWLLVAGLVVRVAGRWWGGCFAVVALLPLMSASGPLTLNGAHGSIEMLLLALVAWTLSVDDVGRVRPWQLGVLAGLLHWVRFGPQVAALVGILIVMAWRWRPVAGDWRALTRRLGGFGWRLLAAYALTVLPLLAWILMALPSEGAWDQLWPVHMVAHYAETYPNRWPQIDTVGSFMTMWLPALIGLGVAITRLAAGPGMDRSDREPTTRGADAGPMFFAVHYAVCCVLLFHNDHAIRGHLWLAWPALALVATLRSRWARVALLAAVVPAIMTTAVDYGRLAAEERRQPSHPLALPNGQQLWFNPAEAKQFGELQALLGKEPRPLHLAVFLSGGGIHHFFATRRVGRHWWYLPGFVRPWEEAVVGKDLLRHTMILVADRGQMAARQAGGPGTVNLWLPLPPPLAQQLAGRLQNPRLLDGIGVLLNVEP